MRIAKFAAASTVWGDGFEDDGWRDIVGVTSWDSCATDEFILVFPGLVPSVAMEPSQALLDHLAIAVAVRAWRLKSMAPGAKFHTVAVRSVTPEFTDDIGQRRHGEWFPPSRAPWLRGLQPFWPRRAFRDWTIEALALTCLDQTLCEAHKGETSAFNSSRAALFAYFAAVHPAYVWPEALLQPEFFTAVAWLGLLQRGRSAMMPLDLAEYFLASIVVMSDRRLRLSDAALESFFPNSWAIANVRRVAEARVRGRKVVARPFHWRAPLLAGHAGGRRVAPFPLGHSGGAAA